MQAFKYRVKDFGVYNTCLHAVQEFNSPIAITLFVGAVLIGYKVGLKRKKTASEILKSSTDLTAVSSFHCF